MPPLIFLQLRRPLHHCLSSPPPLPTLPHSTSFSPHFPPAHLSKLLSLPLFLSKPFSSSTSSQNLNPSPNSDLVAQSISKELLKGPDTDPLSISQRLQLSFSHIAGSITPSLIKQTLNHCPGAGRKVLGFHLWLVKEAAFRHTDETVSFFVDYFGRRKDFKATHELLVEEKGAVGSRSLESMVDKFVRARRPTQVVGLFERMEKDYGFKRDRESLTLIVRKLCENGHASYAEKMVKSLANEIFPDDIICDLLIKGWCVDGKLEEAKRLAKEICRGGFEIGALACNGNLHCVCKLCRKKDPFKVLEGLGFSEGSVRRVLEGFPGVVKMKESEILRKVEFLMEMGIPRNEIHWVFDSFPKFLGLAIQNRLMPLLNEFEDLGFSKELVRKEIVREPRILGMEVGELTRCLELLRSLKCREPIKLKIFGDGAFRAGFEAKLRIDCLCKHGLIRREALKVLWKEPRVIIYDVEDIDRKIEFLVQTMGFNSACLVEVPEYLGVSFEKQIVPRYSVIQYLRAKGGLGDEVGLKGMIKLSRSRFYKLYVKPYPECEKMFGRFSGDVQVRRQHPGGLWKLFKPPAYSQSREDVQNMKSFMEVLV